MDIGSIYAPLRVKGMKRLTRMVEALHEKVATVTESIGRIDAALTGISGDIDALKAAAAALQTALDEALAAQGPAIEAAVTEAVATARAEFEGSLSTLVAKAEAIDAATPAAEEPPVEPTP